MEGRLWSETIRKKCERGGGGPAGDVRQAPEIVDNRLAPGRPPPPAHDTLSLLDSLAPVSGAVLAV